MKSQYQVWFSAEASDAGSTDIVNDVFAERINNVYHLNQLSLGPVFETVLAHYTTDEGGRQMLYRRRTTVH